MGWPLFCQAGKPPVGNRSHFPGWVQDLNIRPYAGHSDVSRGALSPGTAFLHPPPSSATMHLWVFSEIKRLICALNSPWLWVCRMLGGGIAQELAAQQCAQIKQLQVSVLVLWPLVPLPYSRRICRLSFVAPCTSFLFLFIHLLCKLRSQAPLFLYISFFCQSLNRNSFSLFSVCLHTGYPGLIRAFQVRPYHWFTLSHVIIPGLYVSPNILFAISAVAKEWRLTSLCRLFSANLDCSNVHD